MKTEIKLFLVALVAGAAIALLTSCGENAQAVGKTKDISEDASELSQRLNVAVAGFGEKNIQLFSFRENNLQFATWNMFSDDKPLQLSGSFSISGIDTAGHEVEKRVSGGGYVIFTDDGKLIAYNDLEFAEAVSGAFRPAIQEVAPPVAQLPAAPAAQAPAPKTATPPAPQAPAPKVGPPAPKAAAPAAAPEQTQVPPTMPGLPGVTEAQAEAIAAETAAVAEAIEEANPGFWARWSQKVSGEE